MQLAFPLCTAGIYCVGGQASLMGETEEQQSERDRVQNTINTDRPLL